MTFFSRTTWILPLLLLVSGCMQISNASPDIASSDNDVTVIFGTTNVHRVAIMRGISSNGEFRPYREGFTANIQPENGYVVAQLPETTDTSLYAITQFQIVKGGESYGGCEWKQALTFEGHGGKVIYLGRLDFRAIGGTTIEATIEQINDIDNARLYIERKYPQLRGKVEYVEPKLLHHVTRDCATRSGYEYRVIFLPRRR